MARNGCKEKCGDYGGTSRQKGTPCSNTAGQGTDHVGQGKCKYHGGNNGKNFLKHGMYSKVVRFKVGELMEKFRNDPNRKKVEDEIALLRALLANYLDGKSEEQLEQDESLETIMKLADSLSRMIERQERVLNGTTITMETLSRIMDCVAEAVRKRISDPEVIQQIQADWNAIAVMPKK